MQRRRTPARPGFRWRLRARLAPEQLPGPRVWLVVLAGHVDVLPQHVDDAHTNNSSCRCLCVCVCMSTLLPPAALPRVRSPSHYDDCQQPQNESARARGGSREASRQPRRCGTRQSERPRVALTAGSCVTHDQPTSPHPITRWRYRDHQPAFCPFCPETMLLDHRAVRFQLCTLVILPLLSLPRRMSAASTRFGRPRV